MIAGEVQEAHKQADFDEWKEGELRNSNSDTILYGNAGNESPSELPKETSVEAPAPESDSEPVSQSESKAETIESSISPPTDDP